MVNIIQTRNNTKEAAVSLTSAHGNMSSPGIETRLLRGQRDVITKKHADDARLDKLESAMHK